MYVYLDHDLTAETPNAPDGGWPGWTSSGAPSSLERIYGGSPNFGNLVASPGVNTASVARSVASSDTEMRATVSFINGTAKFAVRGGGYYLLVDGATCGLYRGGGVLIGGFSWTPPASWSSTAEVVVSAIGSTISAKAYPSSSPDPGWLASVSNTVYPTGTAVRLDAISGSLTYGELSVHRVIVSDGQSMDIKTVTESITSGDMPFGRTATTSDTIALSDTQVNTRRSVLEGLALTDTAAWYEFQAMKTTGDGLSFSESVTAFDLTRYRFVGPTTAGPRERQSNGLFRRMNIPVGLTVLKEHGFWKTVQNAEAERLAAADRYFLGGHAYPIDGATYTELATAGYGDYCVPDI